MTTFTADRLAVMASDPIATRHELEWMGRCEERSALSALCSRIMDGDLSVVADSLYSASAVRAFAEMVYWAISSAIEQEDLDEGLF